MRRHRQQARAGFSIMPLPIFLVLGIGVGWLIHHYSENLLLAIIGGFGSFPTSVWILKLVFNNPVALRFQNYPGNHSCPTCQERYESFRSTPSDNESLILECFKCGARHRFDKKYHHLTVVDAEQQTKAEQIDDGNSVKPSGDERTP